MNGKAIKNNYGMATFDEKTGRVDMKINAKWPVFGPEYKNIASQFRTVHISDTKQFSVRTYNQLPMPPTDKTWANGLRYGTATHIEEIVEEVARWEHGLGYKPMGYATFSGSISRQTRANVVQTSPTGELGGNWTVNRVKVDTGEMLPDVRGPMAVDIGASGVAYYFWDVNYVGLTTLSDSIYWTGEWVQVPTQTIPLILDEGSYDLHNRIWGEVGLTDVWNFDANQKTCPYFVEFDEKYVTIYRRVFWGDHIVNVFDPVYGSSASNNVTCRVKAIEDWAGSEVDVNVYIVPYKLEDLLK